MMVLSLKPNYTYVTRNKTDVNSVVADGLYVHFTVDVSQRDVTDEENEIKTCRIDTKPNKSHFH
jgi:hypothetical protein